MPLVLGVDSSTQSTKALLVDADDGSVVDSRTAPHPPGTEVDPRAWLTAFDEATEGLIDRADALSIGGQQHGMVALDADGAVVRKALLWNDTRSAEAATQLIAEIGGRQACADAVGSVLVASFTITKLRWLRDHEPENAQRVAAVLLPHDYVSLYAAGKGAVAFTDRGDASGTGYFDARTNEWRHDLVTLALGHDVELPSVVAPGAVAAHAADGARIASGTGDNMAAALGAGLGTGDVLVSIGTSGVVSTISAEPIADGTGTVTGFADANGGYVPMVTTMNAARILDLQAQWLGVSLDELATLALDSAPGSNGVSITPYYGGERTPNLPDATGTWSGLTNETSRNDLARASFEALLMSLKYAFDVLVETTGVTVKSVSFVGGATKSPAVRVLAPQIFGRSVSFLPPNEYVALGAARQAAWTLTGHLPEWPVAGR